MADPFSVFAATIGIIDVTARFVQYVAATESAATTAHQDLQLLLQEFQTLSSVAQSIRDVCTSGVLRSPGVQDKDPDPLINLKRDLGRILNDCKQVAEKLVMLVKNTIGDDCDISRADEHLKGQSTSSKRMLSDSKLAKKLNAFRVTLRKQRKDGEFSQLRLQLHTSQNALQAILSTINLWCDQKAHNLTETSLDRLLEEVRSIAIVAKVHVSSTVRDSPPGPKFTNKHYNADAATHLYTGREALLDHVRDAFNPSVIQSLGEDVSLPTSSMSQAITLVASASSPHRLKVDCRPISDNTQSQRRFVIFGLGGSGKSEFCRKYCEVNQKHFWGIFWVKADSVQNAQYCFQHIAREGGVDSSISAAKSWLASLEVPWLLVIDNADDPSIPINDYLPGGERGHILITTRNPDLKKFGNVGEGHFHFQGLEDNAADHLLLKAAEVPSSEWQSTTMKLASAITKVLGYLPLALIHAGSAIARRLTTLAEYIDYFEETWQTLRWRCQRSGYNLDEFDTRKNVFASYDMMYQHLESQPTSEAKDAIEVLKLFSFLACENIRFDFLANGAKNPWDREKVELEERAKREERELKEHASIVNQGNASSTQSVSQTWNQVLKEWMIELLTKYEDRGYPILPDCLRHAKASGFFRPTRLRQALAELTQKSLVTHRRVNEVDIYSMHPLIHKWVRERPQMRTAEQGIWCRAATNILAQCIPLPPLGTSHTEQELRRHLTPHLDHVLRCEEEFQAKLRDGRKTRWSSWLLVKSPQMDRAKALQFAKYSRVYVECGRWNDAAILQTQVKDYLEKMLGVENPKTLVIVLALSSSLWWLTRFTEAMTLQQQALSRCEKSLGPGHYKSLKLMHLLGRSQSARGRFKEALKLCETAIKGFEKILPPDHKDVLLAVDDLGVVYQKYYRFREAKELHTKAYEGLEKVLGPFDEATIGAKENVAMVNLELGAEYLALARDSMSEIVAVRREQLGKEHGYTLWAICNLARIKSALSHHDEAEKELRAALAIGIRNFGENHLAILAARTHLANILVRQKRYVAAEEIYLDVMERSRYETGAREEGEHPDRFTAMWCAVQCYKMHGKLEEALRLCEDIMERLAAIKGGNHPLAGKVMAMQADLRRLVVGEVGLELSESVAKPCQDFSDMRTVPESGIIRHRTI